MELQTVVFKNDIMQVIENGKHWVSVNAISNNLGISRPSQQSKIKSDPSFESRLIEVDTSGGKQKVFCIPLDKLNGWLFSINPSRVKPEVREKLIEYKNEAFKVLHDYFNKGAALKPDVKEALERQIDDLKAVIMAQNKLIADDDSEPRQIASKLRPQDHNDLLELIYQLSAHKHEIREFTKSMIDRHDNMTNFLNGFAHRYPVVKDYIDKHADDMERQRLNYLGFTKYPKKKK